ncbi:MAG: hypothetical protein C5B47_05265 [Verrucomicrobia bacterium]|nr:MAG: hypothetical protein C5B47_05265 [Verrucomicrobiota bacterium]
MKTPLSFLIVCILLPALCSSTIFAATDPLETVKIEQLTGLKGTSQDGVFTVTAPRSDIPVTVDRWSMPTFMGLTSFAAFTHSKLGAAVVGDIVLFEDEINEAMHAALDHGLAVTALHHYFFYNEPNVYFMHISGEGPAENLAGAVGKIFAAIKAIRAANPAKPARASGLTVLPGKSSITAAPLEAIFGIKGESKDGMFKVIKGYKAVLPSGIELNKEMGLTTWIAFAGNDDDALADGEFAVRQKELQPILKSLCASEINIMAIHQHMLEEKPQYLFLYFWGRGKATEVATALKKALDLQHE